MDDSNLCEVIDFIKKIFNSFNTETISVLVWKFTTVFIIRFEELFLKAKLDQYSNFFMRLRSTYMFMCSFLI